MTKRNGGAVTYSTCFKAAVTAAGLAFFFSATAALAGPTGSVVSKGNYLEPWSVEPVIVPGEDGLGDASALSGVGQVRIGNARCSGSLLSSRQHVISAAHCFTNDNGDPTFDITNVSVDFDGNGGNFSGLDASEVFIADGWLGEANNGILEGNDLAIIELSAEVEDLSIDAYDIYRDTDEVDQIFDIAGFGLTGNGTDGEDGTGLGTRRAGRNSFDRVYGPGGNQLQFDFDNGTPDNDGFFFLDGVANPLGVPNEAMIAPGDSGGGLVLCPDGVCKIAGVISYRGRFGSLSDVNGTLDSSFGEIGGATRVSAFQAFIDEVLQGDTSGSGSQGSNRGDGDGQLPSQDLSPIPAPPVALLAAVAALMLLVRAPRGRRF